MKLSLPFPQAATILLFSLASAAVLPGTPAIESLPKDITAVAGTTGPNHVSIHFQAPCEGCSIGSDNGLELILEIDSAEEECTSSPPRLNGLPLALTKGNDVVKGQVVFKSKSLNGLDEREIHAAWESTCMNGEASIISVRFNDVAGQQEISGTSGFTTSFRQKGTPTVLRLQDKPLKDVKAATMCDTWLRPEDHQKLSVTPLSSDASLTMDHLLEIQHEKLQDLRGQMEHLHLEIRKVESTIVSLVKDEFRKCSSMKCLWEAARSRSTTLTQLIASHFSHHTNRVTGCVYGDSQTPCSTETHDTTTVTDTAPEASEIATQDDLEDAAVENASMESAPASPTLVPEEAVGEAHRGHFVHPRPPFRGFDHNPFPNGPPQGFPQHPPGHHGPPPWFGAMRGDHGRPHGPHGIAQFESHGPHGRHTLERRLTIAVLSILLLVITLAILRRLLKDKTAFFCDPRRRAVRAARKEERQTKRLYRKAACKHKWSTWWNHYRRQCTNDYEEKREMMLEHENISEDVMENEIRALRRASDFVSNLIRAEEGRSGIEYHPQPPTYQRAVIPAELEAGIGSSSQSGIPSTYMAPPPRYEEELEGEVMVVDGFQYTPSTTDYTPESSIIDCNSRLSFETGRSTILTKDNCDY